MRLRRKVDSFNGLGYERSSYPESEKDEQRQKLVRLRETRYLSLNSVFDEGSRLPKHSICSGESNCSRILCMFGLFPLFVLFSAYSNCIGAVEANNECTDIEVSVCWSLVMLLHEFIEHHW